MKLSKREQYIFIGTIIAIACALLYNFVFDPLFKKVQTVNAEISLKKVKLAKAAILLQKRDSIVKEYNNYSKSSRDIPKILNYIENLSASFGLKTSNIKPGPGVNKGEYKEYIIEVEIQGRLPDIIKFLSELIKFPAMLFPQRFEYRASQENPDIFKGTVILSKVVI